MYNLSGPANDLVPVTRGLLLGKRFVLEPGDVVYVVRSPLQRRNGTISRLLPSVQLLSVASTRAN